MLWRPGTARNSSVHRDFSAWYAERLTPEVPRTVRLSVDNQPSGQVGHGPGETAAAVRGQEGGRLCHFGDGGRTPAVRHAFDEALELFPGDAHGIGMQPEHHVDRFRLRQAGRADADRPDPAGAELCG